MRLLIGSKITSSWSMQTWIIMRERGIPFEEVNVPMRSPDPDAIRQRAELPAGKVPCFIDSEMTVWETLAIVESLAERYPPKDLWPTDQRARAHAHAVSSEMHAGFLALRQACPAMFADRAAGPFLYGDFSAADGMFALIVSRLHGYSIDVDPVSRDYMAAVRATLGWRDWLTGARAAQWSLPEPDPATLVEDLRGIA
ncbi:MAG: glutathione S-transferase [Alphaproteobacteria bacterium]|nr:glutathione S-transferase [Alphaproteobacteria bacterium]